MGQQLESMAIGLADKVEAGETAGTGGNGATAAASSPSSPRGAVVRWAQLVGGLVIYGVAMALLIRSGLGLGPWDAFHVGVSELTGAALGVVVIAVGVAIVAGTWFIGVRPGAGTVANMVLIGVFVELLLPVTPAAPTLWASVAYHVVGIVLTGVATGLYIAPGLGKGPRDGMMIGVSERTGWPVRRVRTGIELSVLLLGWLMGARLGAGTVLFALGVGPATEWGLRVFGAGPRR